MPCLPGDALCGLPGNPSDVRWYHSDFLGGAFQAGGNDEKKRKRPEKQLKIKEFPEQLSDYP